VCLEITEELAAVLAVNPAEFFCQPTRTRRRAASHSAELACLSGLGLAPHVPGPDFSLWPTFQKERTAGMAIDRRDFLKIGAGSAVMTLVGSSGITASAKEQTRPELGWHPLTWSLIRRAEDASSAPQNVDTSQVERVISEMSAAQGCARSPVIKWLPDPFSAYAHLKDHSLDELTKIDSATLWSSAGLQRRSDDRSLTNTRCVRFEFVWDIVGVEEHDRALMAPKLVAKSEAMAGGMSAEDVFEVRAVAAQIGWLETSLPVAACHAVDEIDFLLTSGIPEDDELVRHHLRAFRAYELGLLATWETPEAVLCVPRST
jgi:hypothetical protein